MGEFFDWIANAIGGVGVDGLFVALIGWGFWLHEAVPDWIEAAAAFLTLSFTSAWLIPFLW